MPFTTHTGGDQTSEHEVIYSSEGGVSRAGPERREPIREERTTTGMVVGGSTLELIAGGGAVVLAILALTRLLPFYMTAIATIAVGGGLLIHGAAIAARWRATVERQPRDERAEVGGGMGTEILGGAAGVVLGILALAGIMPFTMLAVAAIVLGGTVLIGGPALVPLARFAPERESRVNRIAYQTVEATSGFMALVGVGAVVLGILALLGVGPAMTLVQISMLAIGAGLFFGGGALAARFGRRLQHAS